jgi:hypothetical protein
MRLDRGDRGDDVMRCVKAMEEGIGVITSVSCWDVECPVRLTRNSPIARLRHEAGLQATRRAERLVAEIEVV